MNKTISLLLCLCVSVSSCKKDSSTPPSSTAPSVSWSDNGVQYTASSITATAPSAYGYGNYVLSASSGSHTVRLVLSNIAQGAYTEQNSDMIIVGSDTLQVFDLGISANSGNTASGAFSSLVHGQTYTGAFANILFQ